VSTPARRRSSAKRRRAPATTSDRTNLWEPRPAPAEPAPIVPVAEPAAFIGSLGPVPLPGDAAIADAYIATVVERAAALAMALAASADLLAQPVDD
jgi:hypothetical protein